MCCVLPWWEEVCSACTIQGGDELLWQPQPWCHYQRPQTCQYEEGMCIITKEIKFICNCVCCVFHNTFLLTSFIFYNHFDCLLETIIIPRNVMEIRLIYTISKILFHGCCQFAFPLCTCSAYIVKWLVMCLLQIWIVYMTMHSLCYKCWCPNN